MHNRTASNRNSVFISYSRKDKRFLEEFHTHLSHYVRTDKITYWDDTKITPGNRWKNDLQQALQSARVGVFLVSVNFLASDFIATHELPPLFQAADQEGVVLLSIILSPCLFKETSLANFQAINEPSTPLNLLSRGKRDIIWLKAVNAIKKALHEEDQ